MTSDLDHWDRSIKKKVLFFAAVFVVTRKWENLKRFICIRMLPKLPHKFEYELSQVMIGHQNRGVFCFHSRIVEGFF